MAVCKFVPFESLPPHSGSNVANMAAGSWRQVKSLERSQCSSSSSRQANDYGEEGVVGFWFCCHDSQGSRLRTARMYDLKSFDGVAVFAGSIWVYSSQRDAGRGPGDINLCIPRDELGIRGECSEGENCDSSPRPQNAHIPSRDRRSPRTSLLLPSRYLS